MCFYGKYTCILMPWGVVGCHGVISSTGIAKQYKVPYWCSYAFYKVKGLWHAPMGTLAGVSGCILAYGTRIYMVYGWGSERFLRYKALNEVKGVRHDPLSVSLDAS